MFADVFFKPENIVNSSTKKPSDSNATIYHFFNPGNLSRLHERVTSIHPKWISGLNAEFKKSFTTNSSVFSKFGVDCMGEKNGQIGLEYLFNGIGSMKSTPKIRMRSSMDPYEQSSKLFICFNPLSSFRLKCENHISLPQLFDAGFILGKYGQLAPIQVKNRLNFDWFGPNSRLTWSIHTMNSNAITSSLSFLSNVSPDFAVGAELNANYSRKHKHLSLKPCVAASYSNESTIISGLMCFKSMKAKSVSKVDLSYVKNVSDHFQIGSIAFYDGKLKDTDISVFAQYSVGSSIIRAKIGTNFLIGATYGIDYGFFNISNSFVTNVLTQKVIFGLNIGVDFE